MSRLFQAKVKCTRTCEQRGDLEAPAPDSSGGHRGSAGGHPGPVL